MIPQTFTPLRCSNSVGVGWYCVYLCCDFPDYCTQEPDRLLQKLDAYDHLKHFYQLCVTNIHDMWSHILADFELQCWVLHCRNHTQISRDIYIDQEWWQEASGTWPPIILLIWTLLVFLAWLKDKLEGINSHFLLSISLQVWYQLTFGKDLVYLQIQVTATPKYILGWRKSYHVMHRMHSIGRTMASINLYQDMGIHYVTNLQSMHTEFLILYLIKAEHKSGLPAARYRYTRGKTMSMSTHGSESPGGWNHTDPSWASRILSTRAKYL